MLLNCSNQYVSKFGELSSGHRTGRGQFSLQSQRKAMLKNVQTTVQLCSFCMLARLCSKSLGFSRTSKCTTWVSKRKGTSDQIANIRWIIKKAREFQKNIYFHFVYYAKVFRRHLMGTSPGWIQGYPQDDGIGD